MAVVSATSPATGVGREWSTGQGVPRLLPVETFQSELEDESADTWAAISPQSEFYQPGGFRVALGWRIARTIDYQDGGWPGVATNLVKVHFGGHRRHQTELRRHGTCQIVRIEI